MSVNDSDAENILLRFDADFPCWTDDMLDAAGEDASAAKRLALDGLLKCADGIYSLSEAGRRRFTEIKEEMYLPVLPGDEGTDRRRTALACRLRLIIDMRHAQRWGIKEYMLPLRFDAPDIHGEDLYIMKGGAPEWRWQDFWTIIKMRSDFPDTGLAARKNAVRTADEIRGWLDANSPCVVTEEFSLLYNCHYDFQAYTPFGRMASDSIGLFNTDHFIFDAVTDERADDVSYYMERIGKFHIFLEMLRRMWVPGYSDIDALDQSCVHWLIFSFESEAAAKGCAELLRPVAEDAVRPVLPAEIWSVSVEGLRDFPGGVLENIWDILPFAGNSIFRLA